jgi:CRP-like cAMP-binding protein
MAVTPKPGRTGNRLLDRVPEEEFRLLAPHLEAVHLDCKHDLYQLNDPVSHVYFPLSGVISQVLVMRDGKQVEVAAVGSEGMVGLSVFEGLRASPHAVTCQVPGDDLRLASGAFLQAVEQAPVLRGVMRRYAAASLRLANQVVACNALHAVEERMSRWLLMTHDRVGADEFPLTQEYLAQMLGVRRQTVTVVAGMLQKGGLIAYRRGTVHILDRPRLEEAACECYEVMKTCYERILA